MSIAVRRLVWTPDGDAAVDVQRADLGIHLEIVAGFDETPTVRGEDVVIPGRIGDVPGNRMAHVRDVELAGWVQGVQGPGDTAADRMSSYRTLIRALQAGFDPTKTGVLEVFGEDGNTYTLPLRPLPTIVYGPETVPGVRAVSIALQSTITPMWVVTATPT